MKALMLFLLALCFCGSLLAQVERSPQAVDTVYASDSASIVMLFAEPISLVDLGTGDFIARADQKVLMLKATRPNPGRLTTLFVRYGDEAYFTGFIGYEKSPAVYYYDCRNLNPSRRLRLRTETDGSQTLSARQDTTALVAAKLSQLAELPTEIRTVGITENHLELMLQTVRNDGQASYLKFGLRNDSSMPFVLDFVGFRFREPTKGRELADVLTVIEPLVAETVAEVGAKTEASYLFAIPLYALPRRASLEVIFRERNGSRSLMVSVPMNYLLTAKVL
ncbi:MAG: DUF4138 domain-containing protein [Bacteroidota bacterium]